MSLKREIFKNCLSAKFSNESFTKFTRELLNTAVLVAPKTKKEVRNNFSYYVNSYNHIANYTDSDNNQIAVFSVELEARESVERARSMQRNFVKQLIEDTSCSGAIVAFYTSKNPEKWRLSFIRLDYEFSKGTITEKVTPAKRYSYLVGDKEPCHTAMQRLLPIFLNDTVDPSLDDIESAFSVEPVTKEFFDLYCKKYLDLKEYLEQNEEFVKEATARNFTSEQFAKKLMGQIVFLYFIQKKGWLGVDVFEPSLSEKEYTKAYYRQKGRSREILPQLYKLSTDGRYRIDITVLKSLSDEDEEIAAKCFDGAPWGSGPKDFMRQIFEGCIKAGKNFFDDYLEPLFYTGLNMNRGDNSFYAPLHRRVPFLNGGLFEQLDGYDWEKCYFGIPNEMFSNKDEKGIDADGILDIFDRYNFTMNEDEPLEKEVAIDPEMLGKVFENLLDVKDRKSKGAFYTPREIVHYMCQESLINYLVNKTNISETAIRDFILYGEFMRDEDTKKTKFIPGTDGKKGKYEFDYNKDLLISEEILDYSNGVNRLEELDIALSTVHTVDMAVGSGAFPLGMLNEIVKARNVLTEYMAIGMAPFKKFAFISDGRKLYDLKTQTIKNCIFASDIEPSAVDIAKLRLWLSIVIEDEIHDQENIEFNQTTKPRPLPNLDCNIICGNSLIDEFEGIKLITESSLFGNESLGSQINIYQENVDILIDKLIKLQDRLFFTKEHNEKDDIKHHIQEIYDKIIIEQLKTNQSAVEKYYSTIDSSSKPFVLWQLMFPNVFKEGGFDICIGNPPYVQLQKTINEETNLKLGDLYKNLGFETFTRTGDIYCLFYEKGLQLLKEKGVLSFITSNKWMRAGYGSFLRGFLANNTNPVLLIDFAGQKIFETATVDVNILMFEKNENSHNTKACKASDGCINNLSVYIQQNSTLVSFKDDSSWNVLTKIEQEIKRKIEEVGTPLKEWNISINYGIKTGFNDAFIISKEKKDELIKLDHKSAEIIRPILRGRDIKRYYYEDSDLWLINTHNGIKSKNCAPVDVNMYPAIKNHLDAFYDKLEKRADKGITPYNLRNCAYMDDFSMRKIMYNDITQRLSFSLVPENVFCVNTVYFIKNNEHLEYFLAYLNTKLIDWYYRTLSVQLGEKAVRMFSIYVLKIPVPHITKEIENEIISLLQLRSIQVSLDKIQEIDDKIENIFFDIFNLTEKERDFIIKR